MDTSLEANVKKKNPVIKGAYTIFVSFEHRTMVLLFLKSK